MLGKDTQESISMILPDAFISWRKIYKIIRIKRLQYHHFQYQNPARDVYKWGWMFEAQALFILSSNVSKI